MILTLEGLDCVGKTVLAKKLADFFCLFYFDDDFSIKTQKSSYSIDSSYYTGGDIILCRMYNSFDNFSKTRFQLSEYVYSKLFKRSAGVDFETMDSSGMNKNIVILIKASYDDYIKFSENRKNERKFSKTEFIIQSNLFDESFSMSKCKKMLIQNNKTIDNILDEITSRIIYLMK